MANAQNATQEKKKMNFINGIPIVGSDGTCYAKVLFYGKVDKSDPKSKFDKKTPVKTEPITDSRKLVADRKAADNAAKKDPNYVAPDPSPLYVEVTLPLSKDPMLRQVISQTLGEPALDPNEDISYSFKIPYKCVYSQKKDCSFVTGNGKIGHFDEKDPRAEMSAGAYCNAGFSYDNITVYIQDSQHRSTDGKFYHNNKLVMSPDDLCVMVDRSMVENPGITFAHGLGPDGQRVQMEATQSASAISRRDFGTNDYAAVDRDLFEPDGVPSTDYNVPNN